MTNETRNPHAPANGAHANTPDPSAPPAPETHATEYGPQGVTPEPGPQGGAPGAVNEPSPVQALEAQVADLKDQVLRAYAEMENVRKRGERERQDTQKYAVSKFARDVLSVADNLERAIAAAPPTESADPVLKGLFEGVTVTERALVGILERHGVTRIDALGAQFDPHQHQAVMEQPDPTLPSGTIVRVFEAGYMIGDRVLRPASVVVAKGIPKAPRPAHPQDAAATDAMPSDAGNDNPANGGSSEPSAGA
jgi:molecular chaperone GrpE